MCWCWWWWWCWCKWWRRWRWCPGHRLSQKEDDEHDDAMVLKVMMVLVPQKNSHYSLCFCLLWLWWRRAQIYGGSPWLEVRELFLARVREIMIFHSNKNWKGTKKRFHLPWQCSHSCNEQQELQHALDANWWLLSGGWRLVGGSF